MEFENLARAIKNLKAEGRTVVVSYRELLNYPGFQHLTLSEFEDAWYERNGRCSTCGRR